MTNKTRLLTVLAVLLCGTLSARNQSLAGRWEVRQARGFGWYPATVPGTVHTDLMAAGVIGDPFIGFGERAVQWIDKEDWVYRRSFDVDTALLKCRRVELCFDGLDTYADVTLNGRKILVSDNMFRRWRVRVDSLLQPAGNRLEVLFHSPVKVDMPKWEAYPVHYDPGNDQSRNGGLLDRCISIFARKAGYHYGWDWGPRIVTSGIWRDVRLEGSGDARISDVFYRTLKADSDWAILSIEAGVDALEPIPGAVLRVSAPGVPEVSVRQDLAEGGNLVRAELKIRRPRLWQPAGLGEQYLYEFTASLVSDGREIDSRRDKVGVRTIELERNDDACGRSFRFIVNGEPVFMKGANYIPNDVFLPRVGPEEYARVVGDAAAAGMNMLRVWGGGVYEDELFYRLCDETGILVWQDFMFSCSIYPYEGEFRRSVLLEAEENVRRLRNHPCIALWCGNNECSEMWYGWGAQQGVPFDKVAQEQYNQQYYRDLPSVVERLSPGTAYSPTSPWSPEGSRNMDPMMGDCHYWTPWGQRVSSLEFERHHSRFYSEYGFQSFAGVETIRQFAPDAADWDEGSEMMMFHQRGGTLANQRMMNKLIDEYYLPDSFEEKVYLSQIAQGDIIRRAVESHRRDKPLCWGSLVWQINDCWPVASWSSRDWYGTWKPLHYYLRDAFRDVLPSAAVLDDRVEVWLVSDRTDPVQGRLDVYFEDYSGRCVLHAGSKVKVGANGSARVGSYLLSHLGADPELLYVRMVFTDSAGKTYENLRMLTSVREAKLPKSALAVSVRQCEGGYEVTVGTDYFAKGVYLNLRGALLRTSPDGRALPGACCARNFSDNYFDLPAGSSRTVRVESDMDLDEFKKALEIRQIQKI